MSRALRRDLFGTLVDAFDRYGNLVRLRAGPARGPRCVQRDVIAAFHPDAVRQVLGDEGTFTRDTTSFKVLRELFGENLVTSTGGTWLRQKRTLQPLFAAPHVNRHNEVMQEEALRTVHSLDRTADGVVDIASAMEGYALRVLGRTLFQAQPSGHEDMVEMLAPIVPAVGELVQRRAMQPVRLPLAWPTPRNRRFVEARTELYATIEHVLGRRDSRENHDVAGDLLGLLRRAQDPETGESLSAQELRDQALIFLIAGHTTTSNVLSSTLHLLSCNREIQEQVAQDTVSPTGDDELVLAAVQEGMRLAPPSYAIGRRVLAEADLTGHLIRPGTTVLVSPWITHRHPDFWEQPERFHPERFVGASSRTPYAYFPFGGGPRTCIGRHFAMLEATTMVREILRVYELVAVEESIPRAQQLSLRPSGPVLIRCQPR
jgi:cytochrome P450